MNPSEKAASPFRLVSREYFFSAVGTLTSDVARGDVKMAHDVIELGDSDDEPSRKVPSTIPAMFEALSARRRAAQRAQPKPTDTSRSASGFTKKKKRVASESPEVEEL